LGILVRFIDMAVFVAQCRSLSSLIVGQMVRSTPYQLYVRPAFLVLLACCGRSSRVHCLFAQDNLLIWVWLNTMPEKRSRSLIKLTYGVAVLYCDGGSRHQPTVTSTRKPCREPLLHSMITTLVLIGLFLPSSSQRPRARKPATTSTHGPSNFSLA
jgi:hypothetical protein